MRNQQTKVCCPTDYRLPSSSHPRSYHDVLRPRWITYFIRARLVPHCRVQADGIAAKACGDGDGERESHPSFVDVYQILRKLEFTIRAARIGHAANANAFRAAYCDNSRDRVLAGRPARVHVQTARDTEHHSPASRISPFDRPVTERGRYGLCTGFRGDNEKCKK